MRRSTSPSSPRFYSSIKTLAPLTFIVWLFWYYNSRDAMTSGTGTSGGEFYYEYETITGYFMQSEDGTDSSKFDFRKQNFGLIDREYGVDLDGVHETKQHWGSFEKHVKELNEKRKKGEHYKVLFLGRHGQGWHNVAESKYGTEAWDCYWSLLDGADGMTWSDALLTELGQGQAADVNSLWKELLPKGIPVPETYYVSPLTRTMETADLSFKGLELPSDRPYAPVGKELLREALGVHTCDRRSNASYIRSTFPHVDLEPGFSEDDPLWETDYREPKSARRYRLAQFLDDIFENDDGAFLSLTSHSGAIASILEAIGHRQFDLQTGGVIPVFVQAKRVKGQREVPPKEPSEAPPPCKSPPALSN